MYSFRRAALETHLNATAARVFAPIRRAAFPRRLDYRIIGRCISAEMVAAEYTLAASSRGPEYSGDWEIARCIVSIRFIKNSESMPAADANADR
jgi:hypothetical protein